MNICYAKKEGEWLKNRVYVILPFTNKSGLHCKIKRIFFLMCQIKMYWLNVSNSLFLFMSQLNVSMWQDRGDQNDFFLADKGWGEGYYYCYLLSGDQKLWPLIPQHNCIWCWLCSRPEYKLNPVYQFHSTQP